MARIFKKIPKKRVKREVIKGTRHIQRKRTGRMAGRKKVRNGEKIIRRRVIKPFTLRRKNKKKKYIKGQFI